MMTWALAALCLAVGGLAGHWAGMRMEAKVWRRMADTGAPLYSGGAYWYVSSDESWVKLLIRLDLNRREEWRKIIEVDP